MLSFPWSITDVPGAFEEDADVCRVAEKHGFQINRFEAMKVTDEAALKRQGLMRSTPDYSKIRKLMNEGIPVYGVERGEIEYTFRRPKRGQHAGKDSVNSQEGLLAEDAAL